MKEAKIFFTSNRKHKNPLRQFVTWCIKLACLQKWHHAGLIIDKRAYEADVSGFKSYVSEAELIQKAKDGVLDLLVFDCVIDMDKFNKVHSKGYDYLALIFFQLYYQIFGVWLGRVGEKALRRVYCTEAVAYCCSIPKFWQFAPNNLLKWCAANTNRVLLIENKVTQYANI